ncbi:hypothetical protein [Synechococcus sp. PCC 7336]|uniref:hypothetical protein n=1 Tax=Synechococcus sp. PCC 7336 TaxID=195250 RepID=UPI000344D166|nr:hypothetical protein [Synechococcus sp. PCC 7336]
MPSDLLRQLATIAAILGAFLVNVLSNFYPLNGLNIGEISNTLFAGVQITPASYAFAIWGLIYLALFSFGVYQLLPAQRQNPSLRRIGYRLVWACIAQAIWVFLFLSRQFLLSLLAMLGILLPLIAIYLRLEVGQQRVSPQEQWLVRQPISIYLGWITVATVVNVAIALSALDWSGWGISPPVWTAILIIVSAAIATIAATHRKDAAYPLVIVWASIAIAVRQHAIPLIAVTAIVASVFLSLLVLATQLRKGDRSSLPSL